MVVGEVLQADETPQVVGLYLGCVLAQLGDARPGLGRVGCQNEEPSVVELRKDAVSVFAAVTDTLLPAVDGPGEAWTSSATDLGLPDRLPELFASLPDDRARADLNQLLGLLATPGAGLVLYGKFKPFVKLSADERTAALRRMAKSRIGPVRQGFRALKLLAGFLYMTPPEGRADWPVWTAMSYPGPNGAAPAEPKRLRPLAITGDTKINADVVVVGSGAGGGPAAAVLAVGGLDVVIVEKGGYRNESDFSHREAEAYRDMYLDGSLSATTNGAIALLAGSTLGGGTVINYTTSFATPDRLRSDWDRESGLAGVFTGADYAAASDAVHARLGVNTDNNDPSRRDVLMEKGLRDLGWHVDAMPRNVAACDGAECGYCGLGCRTGSKQSSLRTWIEDAAEHGARIIVDADVERITMQGDTATGIVARVGDATLTVRARAVVVAAGALNTPAVLSRSHIGGSAVGRHLHLHPVTAVWGRFDEPVEPWTGIMQALYSDEFVDLDSAGYGFKFETAAVHPVFPALFFGWDDGARFKQDLIALRYWSPIGILLRDRGWGRVSVRKDGRPAWKYSLSTGDTVHMKVGVRKAAEVLAAAGAREVLASTTVPVRWDPARGGIDNFAEGVAHVGYGPNQTAYLSFHQMGSTRMGADPATSVVGPDNCVHGVAGVYVMDGSCFPSASGVNPMMSIQTIAHRGASLLASELTAGR